MKTNITKFSALAALALGLLASAHANTFTLDNSTATFVDHDNTTSAFYQVNSANKDHADFWESGSASSLYSFTTGGDSDTGFWVNISFDGNPQPVLTSAFMKAGDGYLWWDAADLAAFNAGTFTSLTLVQDGIWNPPHNALLNISHAGINGGPGEEKVPDGGTTAILIGLGLAAMSFFARRRTS